MLAIIRSALPQGIDLKGSLRECRNPDWAHVWVSTPPHPTNEGAMEWWTLACHREQRNWSCYSAEHHREANVEATVTGITRHIKIQVDGEGVEMQRALELTTRAMDLIQDPASAEPECRAEPQRKPDAKAWEEIKTKYRLKPGDDAIVAEVSRNESGTVSVDLFEDGGPAITFSADAVDCWGEWIVVT